MPGKTARGRFVWHELMVQDTAQAHEFYSKVVGWKTQAFEQDPSYQMFAAGSGPLGGSVAHASGPAHWLPFLGTDDIEATVAEATELGAQVVTPVTPIPNGGRWAGLIDPQGAKFGVYQSAEAPKREKPPQRGEFSWHELMTGDYRAAFEFYSKLFGWETAGEADMGPPLGVYFMFGRNGVPQGGMFKASAEMGGPAWCGYIRVKDVHKAVKKATAGGATLINGPMEVPGGDWIAQFIDPQGALFAVHQLQADLQIAAPAAPQQGALELSPPPAVTSVAEPEPAPKAKPKARPAAKPAAKKPAAKKPAAKKPAAKKPAAKTSAAKPTAKKAAAKPAAKKKAVAKKRGKTAAKPAAKRKAVKRPAPKRAKKSVRPAAPSKNKSSKNRASKKKARRPK